MSMPQYGLYMVYIWFISYVNRCQSMLIYVNLCSSNPTVDHGTQWHTQIMAEPNRDAIRKQ
jgi:hypothetical protein